MVLGIIFVNYKLTPKASKEDHANSVVLSLIFVLSDGKLTFSHDRQNERTYFTISKRRRHDRECLSLLQLRHDERHISRHLTVRDKSRLVKGTHLSAVVHENVKPDHTAYCVASSQTLPVGTHSSQRDAYAR